MGWVAGCVAGRVTVGLWIAGVGVNFVAREDDGALTMNENEPEISGVSSSASLEDDGIGNACLNDSGGWRWRW